MNHSPVNYFSNNYVGHGNSVRIAIRYDLVLFKGQLGEPFLDVDVFLNCLILFFGKAGT